MAFRLCRVKNVRGGDRTRNLPVGRSAIELRATTQLYSRY